PYASAVSKVLAIGPDETTIRPAPRSSMTLFSRGATMADPSVTSREISDGCRDGRPWSLRRSSRREVGGRLGVSVQTARVLVEQGGPLGGGEVVVELVEHGLALGPERVAVREVDLDHDPIEPDVVAQRQRRRIGEGGEPEVAVERLEEL